MSCCFTRKVGGIKRVSEGGGEGGREGLQALSSPLTNMRLCLIIKCLLSRLARQSHGPPSPPPAPLPKKSDTTLWPHAIN